MVKNSMVFLNAWGSGWTSWEPVQPVLQEDYGQPSVLAFFEPVSIGASNPFAMGNLWSILKRVAPVCVDRVRVHTHVANHSGYGIGVLLISPHGDHIPRSIRLNQFVDALATLASMIDIPTDTIVRPLLIKSRSVPTYSCLIDEANFDDGLPWYHDIYQFLRLGAYPEAAMAKDKRTLRQLVAQFVICGETLPCLYRLSDEKGLCGSLWTTHGRPYVSPGHEFILVAIDYFTKWVKVASYARLTSYGVVSLIRSHIICRYGIPHELIFGRGVHFRADVDTLLQRYGIQHHRSSAYRPQTNGAVEAANKNIKRILRMMVETFLDWSEKLPFALWAY
uniref:Integrase catalytic domain-containing protein n=1 Tax=Vitis vinifera TaxID=29760 RepID=A5B720_VITVI|nr:hypothetical protein VITISV_038489 [Vitis vinifera]